MFKPFTMKDVYEYAELKGYKKEDVQIKRIEDEFGDFEPYYEVSFGHEYTEIWTWEFSSLDDGVVADDYTHEIIPA